MHHKDSRLVRALARAGLHVSREGNIFHVRLSSQSQAPKALVLLPDGLPVEGKAFHQLAQLAATTHPVSGTVLHACATPDFHPGDPVPVGSVMACPPDMVIPQAVGTDINCGMRLHVLDVPVEVLRQRKATLVERLKGDLLLGTRNLPMAPQTMRAMFEGGVPAFLESVSHAPLGQMSKANLDALMAECARIHFGGTLPGSCDEAPEDLIPADRDEIRDGGLGTVGGGNHFVEFQVVREVMERQLAWQWGVKVGQVAVMIHTGSRMVGVHVGRRWMDKARQAWPKGLKHPGSGIFPLRDQDADQFITAMSTAANYGFVNRMLLAEMIRQRVQEVFGARSTMPLVYDLPHNLVFRENGMNVHRKGATPAHEGQPVIIPGSMGHSSFLLVGMGQPRMLSSASHGAGRAVTRFEMGRTPRKMDELGLGGVECITLKEERRIEEAPAAYKPIGPVVDAQVQAGVAKVVARMEPLFTFKA